MYEGTIEEGEDCDWEDEPSGTEEISFLRTKSKVISRHSLITEGIHGNRGGSAMQNVASFSSPESRRPRTPNGSRASSPRSTRRKMFTWEMPGDLRQALTLDRRPWVTLPDESREGFDAGFPIVPQEVW